MIFVISIYTRSKFVYLFPSLHFWPMNERDWSSMEPNSKQTTSTSFTLTQTDLQVEQSFINLSGYCVIKHRISHSIRNISAKFRLVHRLFVEYWLCIRLTHCQVITCPFPTDFKPHALLRTLLSITSIWESVTRSVTAPHLIKHAE